MVSTLDSGPSSPGFDFQRSQKVFRRKNIAIADVNKQRWLEESGQWLENVDRTHLVLSSGKQVQQKLRYFRTRPFCCGVKLHQ